MKQSIIRRILISVTATAAIAASMSSGAASMGETHVQTSAEGLRTRSVSYADLDLSTAEGMDALESRLNTAARQVCGSATVRGTGGSLSHAAQNRSCYESAIADAMSEVRNGNGEAVAVASR